MIALLVQKRLDKMRLTEKEDLSRKQKGALIACGLVAGSALMDVFLAIPFSIFHSPDALQLVGESWKQVGVYLGALSTLILAWWISHRVCFSKI